MWTSVEHSLARLAFEAGKCFGNLFFLKSNAGFQQSNVQSFDHVAAKSCIGTLPWKLQMPGKSRVHDDLQVLNFKLLSFIAFLLMSRTWCGTVNRMHPSSAWNFQVQILSLRLTIFLTFPSGQRLATQSVAKDEVPRVFASFEDMSFEDPHG